MDILERVTYLRRVPLFSRLSDTNLRRIAEIAKEETFRRHSHLADVGKPARAFYYILSGEAVVYSFQGAHRHLRPVGYLRAGNFFGVTSLLLGEPHDATIATTTEVRALVIDRDDFNSLLRNVPELEGQLAMPPAIRSKMRHERFPWLDHSEVVIYVGRRHWYVYARAMLLPTLAALVFSALILFLVRTLQIGSWVDAAIVALVFYIPAALWNLVDWRNDYFIVTTQRVAHREFVLYQVEEVRHEAPLNMIQDVAVERGIWGNLLGFGDVRIETAAQAQLGRIIFDHVPDPEAVKDAIFQQIYRAQARRQIVAREEMRRELRRHLGWLTSEELRAQGEARIPPQAPPPGKPRRSWQEGLRRFRFIPPLRLEEGSRITWRKHWIFLLRKISRPLLAAIVWLALLIAHLTGFLSALIPLNSSPGVLLGLIVLAIPIAAWFWWQAVDWENDIYVLTDDRIIDIEKKPLFFAEQRREATLDRIQNVNLVVPGPMAALLGYGNVDIDTAGGEGKFTFTHVVAPHTVQRDIMSRVARYRQQRQQLESLQRRREVIDWLATYEELQRERRPPPTAGPTSP